MLIFPLICAALAGGAYGILFRRRFEDSLMPAFLIQILLMLLSGMLFGSLTVGIVTGILTSAVIWIIQFARKGIRREPRCELPELMSEKTGLFCFILLFLIVCALNTGKYFSRWDEFSHWGIFLKESLRTDRLYCVSEKPFVHKDYVPALTLFEVLWAKLTLRFREEDAFRAIQMLQLSVLLPLVTLRIDRIIGRRRRLITLFLRAFWLLGIPLVFSSLNFFHSIYTDAAVGFLLFYCMWQAHSMRAGGEKALILALALSGLVLTKMIAIVFLPMVVIYWVVRDISFDRGKGHAVYYPAALALPAVLWFCYNRFAAGGHGYAGGQNYGGHGFGTLMKVLSRDGSIPYQAQVEKLYLRALLTRGILWKLPFAGVVLLVIALLLFMAWRKKRSDENEESGRIALLALWTAVAACTYTMIMYYLYMTSFSQYEASMLTGFERYMSSLLLPMVLFVPAVCFEEFTEEGSWSLRPVIAGAILCWGIACAAGGGGQIRQMLPGIYTGESELLGDAALFLREHVPEDSAVLVVFPGEPGFYNEAFRYACWPMEIVQISPDTIAPEEDPAGEGMGTEAFASLAEAYDYLYCYETDEECEEWCRSALRDAVSPVEHGLYRITAGD